KVRLWDTESGKELLALDGHRGTVRCLAFSPDGRFLASGGDDQLIKLRDATTGEDLPDVGGGTGAVLSLAFGPKGRLVASSADRTLEVWDTSTRQPLVTLPRHTDS